MTITIPMLDMKRQLAPLRAEIDRAIAAVIDSGQFLFGPQIEEFEQSVCRYTGSPSAVAVSNGTDAIRCALLAAGVKPGDGVVCPAFTYYATAGAVASIGAVPVFADIEPRTYTLNADGLERALQRHRGSAVTGVIPVHLYGQCADMDPLLACAKAHKLAVIEDDAQAFGAAYKGRKSGTIGLCGTVSFFPGKNLGAFGDAGMVLTAASVVRDALCLLRNQGNAQKYFHSVVGFNHRMDTLQACVLQVKLKYLDGWNARRQDNARFYNEQFRGLPLETPYVPAYTTHIYHQYVLRVPSGSKALREHLHAHGIDARVFYPVPLHLQECFRYLGCGEGDFPESEKASRETLAIPVHPDLTEQERDLIVETVKAYFRKH